MPDNLDFKESFYFVSFYINTARANPQISKQGKGACISHDNTTISLGQPTFVIYIFLARSYIGSRTISVCGELK